MVLVDNLFKASGTLDHAFETLIKMPGVSYINTDLSKPLTIETSPKAFDIIYHLAAINGTQLFYDIPYQVARTNLLTTLHLLDWLERQAFGKLVYASTSEVYAGCEQVGLLVIPTGEDTPVVFPQPTHIRFSYGTSKFMGEFLCARFGEKMKIPVSIVRYHNVYGPRMGHRHVIPEFLERIKRRENPFRIYGGTHTRAFCYIDDAVTATFLVATTPRCDGEILHVGNSQEEISIEALARLLLEQYGETVNVQECGGPGGSVSRRCPNTKKLKQLTGFEAQISLRQGLSRTCEWYLSTARARP